jgi:chromosome segregation ATPase
MADNVARKSPDMAKRVAHGEISLPAASKAIDPKPAKQPKADPRDAEIERLREELAESRDNARELSAMVEASDFAAQGEASAAKQIKRLLDEIATLKSQRDGYMTKCNELIKTVKHWKNKAGAK